MDDPSPAFSGMVQARLAGHSWDDIHGYIAQQGGRAAFNEQQLAGNVPAPVDADLARRLENLREENSEPIAPPSGRFFQNLQECGVRSCSGNGSFDVVDNLNVPGVLTRTQHRLSTDGPNLIDLPVTPVRIMKVDIGVFSLEN